MDTGWAAFSSLTSWTSLKILIATRPRRDPAIERQLANMARSLRRLRRSLGVPESEAVGDLIWAFLRRPVMERMAVEGASERQRPLLVAVLTDHVERAA